MTPTNKRAPDGGIIYLSTCDNCSENFERRKKRKANKCNKCNTIFTAEKNRAKKKTTSKETVYKKVTNSLLVTSVGITKESLQELFTYHKEGVLTYNYSISPRAIKNTVAGSWSGNNYKQVSINNKRYLVHRLIYIYHYGNIDNNMYIDHKNRCTYQNNIENLRAVTVTENNQNTIAKGYVYTKGKYKARITVNKKVINLGIYETAEEAQSVYYKAKEKYHI